MTLERHEERFFGNALPSLKENHRIRRLMFAIGTDATFSLADILRRRTRSTIFELCTYQDVKMQLPVFAFISGYTSLVLSDHRANSSFCYENMIAVFSENSCQGEVLWK